jgi:ferric-dicitrate binding protein FerR (iron transport regulator)
MTIRLSDGSTALLAPQSSISYRKYFDGRARNISLIGKAEFKVARDITRPFTVFAGEFATTALGTRFEVNALGKDDIVVKLFEGKVMVNSTSGGKKFDAVYLSPGLYVTFNVIDKTAKIKSFIKADNLHSPDREKSPDEGNDHMLTFKRESLKNVFDKVSALYNIPIQYQEKQIRELYFTGYIQRSDSIKNVLKVIANMNGLKLQDMGDHVVILGK